ncbi:EAL domain-containing protein [Novosphingobium sp.]|uniref:EAL domain-containing protein n=1 Tax=Novosphingobium sp. TaxID=1874826 RepID=UPI003341E222
MRRLLRSPLWLALLIGAVIPALGLSDPVGQGYWNVCYKLFHESAPASIVVVNSDDIADMGTAGQTQLFDLVRGAKPARLFIDTKLQRGVTKDQVAALRAAIARLSPDTAFVSRARKFDQFDRAAFDFPDPAVIGAHPVVLSAWTVNMFHYVESGPSAIAIDGTVRPVLATELAHLPARPEQTIYPDFAIDPSSVTTFSARHLLDGQVPASALAGKQVVIAGSGQGTNPNYFGQGPVSPVVLDIAGAVSMRKPWPFTTMQLPLLALVALVLALARRQPRRRLAYSALVVLVLVVPAVLRTVGIVCYPDAAICAMVAFAAIRLWQKRVRKIQHTSASGLPNMLALSNSELPPGRDVVVAAIARYDEMLATLPQDLHDECARQIARRIAVACEATELYHADGGHFAWTEEARPLDMQLSHLEGLRALFASPVMVGTHTFDINIHFGLDRNEGVKTATRVNSALASSNEALANGRAIELFEAHRLAEAPWELSLHSRIDEGLRDGDIWLAYQAQWDIATNRICGAEALIRWNHPTRGAIAPNAFILQAERAGRIDALTYWVLDQAITAALAINAKGERFQMSVNLSAQMVDKPDLVGNFAAIVARRGVDPTLITVEVTETSAVGNRPAAVHNLTRLRQIGFRLSIDDFGTGEASLAYLADLPSDELKLDRCFVSRIVTSPRDRAIVASTIGLAHALGQTVVAEGIEDAATLALLRQMGCDYAQGFYLGRPQPFVVFEREYTARRQRQSGAI